MTEEHKLGISIPVISWLDQPVKQSVKAVFDKVNVTTEALDLLRRFRRAHFKSLRASVERVKIMGMSSPVNLRDVYSPAHVSETIHRRLYQREWRNLSDVTTESAPATVTPRALAIPADAYIDTHDKVVVLGRPGSGKTTLLKWLALCYMDKQLFAKSKLKTSLFPIFVSLPYYANTGVPLDQHIGTELEKLTDKYGHDFIRRLFRKGFACVLLDSLDEVRLNERKRVTTAIKDFVRTYPDCKILLSCRTADYEEPLETFYEVELVSLSREAVHRIIRAWFGGDTKRADQLIRHLKADPGTASLTETPLLLSLLCIQFRHDLALPKRKTELYRRCVDALLREWDASRGFRRDTAYASLSDDRKERIFEVTAGHFFNEPLRFTFPERELLEVIGDYCRRFSITSSEAAQILVEIERHHGILERFSADSYAFSHPSFQEYFAARYFLARRREVKITQKYFENENWSSVIEFMVALKEDPEDLLGFLMTASSMRNIKNYPAMARRTKHLWLLYRCMVGGADVRPDFEERVYGHLVQSQVYMANIYLEGGVIPLAVLMEDGVRHAYYYSRKRDTLYKALQPFRKLANEILLSPSEDYAQQVARRIRDVVEPETRELLRISLALCLTVPLASVTPSLVDEWLDRSREWRTNKFLHDLIDESKTALRGWFQER